MCINTHMNESSSIIFMRDNNFVFLFTIKKYNKKTDKQKQVEIKDDKLW